MGGLLSSRWGGHARRRTVGEAYLSVRTQELAALPVGASGSIEWSAKSKPCWASIGFHVTASNRSLKRIIELYWGVTSPTGDSDRRQVSIAVVPTALTFGTRWWVRCPVCNRRCGMLYLVTPRDQWQCRVCARLGYFTQRLSQPSRLTHRAETLVRRRLGAEWTPYGAPPSKPSGMHRRTYRRLVNTLRRIEEKRDQVFLIGTARLLARIPANGASRREPVPIDVVPRRNPQRGRSSQRARAEPRS